MLGSFAYILTIFSIATFPFLLAAWSTSNQDFSSFLEIYVRRGDNVSLQCSDKTSREISLVIWKTPNNTQVPLSSERIGLPTPLQLLNISFPDAGRYSCIAYSPEGQKFNHSINVVVKDIPDPPRNITLISKSSSSLYASWMFGNNRNSPILLHSVYIYENGNLVKQQNVSTPLNTLQISGLKQHKCYSVILRALNDVGWSIVTLPVYSMTYSEKIEFPPLLNVHNVSAVSIVLSEHSRFSSGGSANVSANCKSSDFVNPVSSWNYVTYVSTVEPKRLVAEHFNPVLFESVQLITISSLQPFTRYNISVAFQHGQLQGPSSQLLIQTLESVPDPPVFVSKSSTNSSIIVRWRDADKITGVVVAYKLELYRCGANQHVEPDESLCLRRQQLDAIRKEFTFEILDANVCYSIRIAAATSVGFGRFSELYSVHTDVSDPLPPELLSATFVESNNILLNWTCSGPCASHLEPLQNHYVVCWSTIQSTWQPSCLRTQTIDASHRAFCYCEGTRKFHTTTLPWSIVQHSTSDRAVFTVRSVRKRSTCDSESNCERESADSNTVSLDLRGASGRRFYMNLGAATVSIVAVSLFIISAISFSVCLINRLRCMSPSCYRSLFCRRSVETLPCKYRRAAPMRFNKTAYEPLLASQLQAHVAAAHANNDAGFQVEFEAIEHAVCIADWTAHIAKLPENATKNRYSNVLAYDHTRVILKEHTKKSDYINANYVDGYHRRAAYIAAQGPTPTTFDDFWLMVWEQACNVIVMISNFIERGRRKCDKYWPSSGQQLYGTVSVRVVCETVRAFFTTRIFAIRHVRCKRSIKERLVYHYQYTDWRDFDVPLSPLPVLKFVEATVSHWTMEDGPIVVHCSAGVGRTGTYICIESLIRQLKAEKLVTIRSFLEHIRQQRMKLVQTEQQYAFIHDALREFALNPCHSIRATHFADYLFKLRSLDSSGRTNLEKQFEMCVESESGGISHPRLTNSSIRRRGSCSMFGSASTELLGIDASSLHGYHTLSEYIVARHPHVGSEAEFWKMVWDENSSTIVCLSSPEMPSFWPNGPSEIRNIGWLHVSYAGSRPCGNSLTRFEFLLTSDREDYALACTLWRLNEWSSNEQEHDDDLKLARALLDLVSHVVDDVDGDDRESHNSSGSIVVVDDTGGRRVGTFCALCILINQFLRELSLDVYFVFKMLCVQRPGIFQSYRDLEFIYTLLEHFLTISSEHDLVERERRSSGPTSHSSNRSAAHYQRRSKVMANMFSHRRKSRFQTDTGDASAVLTTLPSTCYSSHIMYGTSPFRGAAPLRHSVTQIPGSHKVSIMNRLHPVVDSSVRSQTDLLLSSTHGATHCSVQSLPTA